MRIDDSIIVLNKKAGRTSHDEVAIIRSGLQKIGIRTKVGHSGTLDPKVTGLLVVGIGRGTKMLEYMLNAPKEYIGDIYFHADVSRSELDTVMESFIGTVEQLPPRKSSVKREVRTRQVYELEILEFSTRKARVRCRVERGTYIRKLFHDIGEQVGCGAHMGDLHRTHVGPYMFDQAVISAEEFKKNLIGAYSRLPFRSYVYKKKLSKHIHSIKSAIPDMPHVRLWPGIERHLTSGEPLFIPGVQEVDSFEKGDEVLVVSDRGEVIALGYAQESSVDMISQEKGVAVAMRKVFL